MGLMFVWQLASGFLHTESVAHEAVAISSVSLEPDPNGVRVDFVVVDRQGVDTTVGGDLSIKLREPDGAVWQTTRGLAPEEFAVLHDSHLLAGRLGYSVLVPASDWVRAPRHGGSASISLTIQPRDDGASTLTKQAEERFP